MFKDPRGPIEGFSWAKFTVNGEVHSRKKGVGKDIFVMGSKAREWKNMGGHHLNERSLDLLDGKDIDVLIIGSGVYGVVDVNEDVREKAKSLGIRKLIVQRTEKACGTYNDLYHMRKRVALLAHGTC